MKVQHIWVEVIPTMCGSSVAITTTKENESYPSFSHNKQDVDNEIAEVQADYAADISAGERAPDDEYEGYCALANIEGSIITIVDENSKDALETINWAIDCNEVVKKLPADEFIKNEERIIEVAHAVQQAHKSGHLAGKTEEYMDQFTAEFRVDRSTARDIVTGCVEITAAKTENSQIKDLIDDIEFFIDIDTFDPIDVTP